MRKLCMGVVALALAASACGGTEPSDDAIAGAEARSLLIDRNWLDRWPTSKDDRLHVYRFTPSMGGGVYQDRTLFKGLFELFQFEADDQTVVFYLPDEGLRVRTRYTIERVQGPKPFDLRLTFERTPRGPRTYHGMSKEGSGEGPALVPLALEQ